MDKERPVLQDLVNFGTTDVEKFQNEVLRPIIKMQHNLLIAFFENYLQKRKIDLSVLALEKKKLKIQSILEKDNQFRNIILGSILGHFSKEEYTNYCTTAKDINKRIVQITIQRLQNSL